MAKFYKGTFGSAYGHHGAVITEEGRVLGFDTRNNSGMVIKEISSIDETLQEAPDPGFASDAWNAFVKSCPPPGFYEAARVEMGMIVFDKEEGGHIDFTFDDNRFLACQTSGTSVPLYEDEYLYVPDKNDENGRQELHYLDDEVRQLGAKVSFTQTNTQVYAKRFECYTTVYLYEREALVMDTPKGYRLALVQCQNGVYNVIRFI